MAFLIKLNYYKKGYGQSQIFYLTKYLTVILFPLFSVEFSPWNMCAVGTE